MFYNKITFPSYKVSARSSAYTASINLEHSNIIFSVSTQNTHHYRVYFLAFKQGFLYISCMQKHSFVPLPIIIYTIIEGEKQWHLQSIYGISSYFTPQFFLENTQIQISGLNRALHLIWVIYPKMSGLLKTFPSSSTLCSKDQQ